MSDNETTATAENLERSRSKYELTLAEFPTFPLSRSNLDLPKSRVFEDTITGKDGEQVKRIWTVIPHESLGFGTPSTHATLFELMQIWKEQGFASQYIHFKSIYHLLKRMGKGTGNSQYKQIEKDLEVLVGIIIKAKNAFWDNDRKGYVDAIFHLFESVGLYKESPDGKALLEFGFIKASDYLFYNSILKSSLLSLPFDRHFFHRLTPAEQRLALYLSKVFRSQTVNKRELLEFGRQLPLETKEVKYIKRQLMKNCDGLIKKGFSLLAGYIFKKGADRKSEYVFFKRKGAPANSKLPYTPIANKHSSLKQPRLEFKSDKTLEEIDYLTNQIMGFCKDQQSLNFYKKVASLISRNTIFRALSEVQDAENRNETKKSRGAHFTWLVKRYAEEQGVKL